MRPMRRSPRAAGSLRRAGLLASTAVVLFLLVAPLPSGAAAPVSGSSGSPQAAAPSAGPFSANLTWNKVNVNSANSASSALSLSFGSTANLLFSWSSSTPVNINDARLQMIYFDAALSTRDVSPVGTGPLTSNTAVMNWTPGELTYVLEGVYKITASLIAANGTTMWSENFYVRANAPYYLLAILPLVLLIIGAWELYEVARSGRQAMLSKKKGAPPRPPPPSTPPPSGAPPPSSSAPESAPPEPKEEST